MNQEVWITIFGIIPMVVGLLFAIIFYFNRQKNQPSDLFISLLFFSFFLIQLISVFEVIRGTFLVKYLIVLVVTGIIVLPPTIFLYVNSLTLKSEIVKAKKHFLIPAIVTITNIIVFTSIIFLESHPEIKNKVVDVAYLTAPGVMAVLFPLMSIYYIIKSFKSIKRHRIDIGDVLSYEEGVNLKWVKVFLYSFIVFFVLVFTHSVGTQMMEERSFLWKISYSLIIISYISFVAFKAFEQSKTNFKLSEIQSSSENEFESSTASFDSKSDVYNLIWENVQEIMISKEPFTDINLTIYDLAKVAETNYKYLSKSIKQHSNQNFVSYVNSYRIEKSKELLKNTEYNNYTIEALAEMSGFKSKSAFNTAFKKLTGKTPSQYKREG